MSTDQGNYGPGNSTGDKGFEASSLPPGIGQAGFRGPSFPLGIPQATRFEGFEAPPCPPERFGGAPSRPGIAQTGLPSFPTGIAQDGLIRGAFPCPISTQAQAGFLGPSCRPGPIIRDGSGGHCCRPEIARAGTGGPAGHAPWLFQPAGFEAPPCPPGVRFVPSDEELIAFYLAVKVRGEQLPCTIIKDVALYSYHPEELTSLFKACSENVWYFFTSRERKHPKGERPNRTAVEGYWRNIGSEVPIRDGMGEVIGYKRSLAYYQGKQRDVGIKTEWMMTEYRVTASHRPANDSSLAS